MPLRNLDNSQLALIHISFGMIVPCIRPALFHIHTKQNGNRKPYHEHEEKERVAYVAHGVRDESDNKRTQKNSSTAGRKRSACRSACATDLQATLSKTKNNAYITGLLRLSVYLCIARPCIALECRICKSCPKVMKYITPQLPARTKVDREAKHLSGSGEPAEWQIVPHERYKCETPARR